MVNRSYARWAQDIYEHVESESAHNRNTRAPTRIGYPVGRAGRMPRLGQDDECLRIEREAFGWPCRAWWP